MTTADRKPLWLYPNLLSLDAPLVALAWLHIFAKTWRLGYHPWQAYLCLGLAVWVIYVADRLLDVSLHGASVNDLEPRHRFHQRYRKWMVTGLILSVIVATNIVLTGMPRAIFMYLALGGVLVAGFFGLSMLASQDHKEVALSKNIIAGLTFAFGTAMTAHLYRAQFGFSELILSREFICFAILCVLNISAIDFWEHSAHSDDVEVKASDELSVTLPLVLLGFSALMFAIQDTATRPFYYAILTGAALMYVLNRKRAEFSMDALRVLADVALIAPLLVYYAAQGQ